MPRIGMQSQAKNLDSEFQREKSVNYRLTVKSLLPFSPVLPRSYLSSYEYPEQLSGEKRYYSGRCSEYVTKFGFLFKDQLKSNYYRDGPQQLSDPLTSAEVTKLKICIKSAFKYPRKLDSWADPYYPGMPALIKWFSLFFDSSKNAQNRVNFFVTCV